MTPARQPSVRSAGLKASKWGPEMMNVRARQLNPKSSIWVISKRQRESRASFGAGCRSGYRNAPARSCHYLREPAHFQLRAQAEVAAGMRAAPAHTHAQWYTPAQDGAGMAGGADGRRDYDEGVDIFVVEGLDFATDVDFRRRLREAGADPIEARLYTRFVRGTPRRDGLVIVSRKDSESIGALAGIERGLFGPAGKQRQVGVTAMKRNERGQYSLQLELRDVDRHAGTDFVLTNFLELKHLGDIGGYSDVRKVWCTSTGRASFHVDMIYVKGYWAALTGPPGQFAAIVPVASLHQQSPQDIVSGPDLNGEHDSTVPVVAERNVISASIATPAVDESADEVEEVEVTTIPCKQESKIVEPIEVLPASLSGSTSCRTLCTEPAALPAQVQVSSSVSQASRKEGGTFASITPTPCSEEVEEIEVTVGTCEQEAKIEPIVILPVSLSEPSSIPTHAPEPTALSAHAPPSSDNSVGPAAQKEKDASASITRAPDASRIEAAAPNCVSTGVGVFPPPLLEMREKPVLTQNIPKLVKALDALTLEAETEICLHLRHSSVNREEDIRLLIVRGCLADASAVSTCVDTVAVLANI